ncbi:hypothetical protein Ddc_16186 [Ditylenchus destructor]|nr:hypothetical protein Ddc_16186 [Ditylenchus destructor]
MCSVNIHIPTSSYDELREPAEKVSPLANETLVEVLKYLNFKELINAQTVCSKWSKIAGNHRHELASPFIPLFTLDTMLAGPRLVFSVTKRPECLEKCGQESWMDRAYQELVGKNICPTGGPDDKISMRFVLQRATNFLIDDSIRELSLICRNELTEESLPHVLHFFKHLRDHYAFIEQVSLCPFNLDLWRMTSTRFCASNDLLRCKHLFLSCHDPNSTVGILAANVKFLFLTPDYPKSFDKSPECMASTINFILFGSRSVTGQLIVHDFFNEEIFDHFIQAFQSIPDTDSMIGAIAFEFSFKRVDLSSVLEKYKHSTRSRQERDVHHPAILYTEFCYEFVHHSQKSVIEVHVADLTKINRVEVYLKYLVKF